MKTPVAPLSGAVLAWVLLAGCSAPPRREGLDTEHGRPDLPYSFSKPPYVHPKVVQDLMTWLSDSGDQVVAINLLDSQDSNRYSGEVKVRESEGEAPYVYVTDGREKFGYEYVGTTTSGIDVLCTSDCGGGSGIFMNLLLVRWEEEMGIDCDWQDLTVRPDRKRLLIRKVGEIALGDRWAGKLEVRGNDLFVGKDEGWFTVSGGRGGGALSYDRKDRVLKVDLSREPRADGQDTARAPARRNRGTSHDALYDRMSAAVQPGPGLQQTQLAHIGHVDTADGRYEVCVQHLVITGMLAPHGQTHLLLFNADGRLVHDYDYPFPECPPLWCEGGKIYLFGFACLGIPIDPPLAASFPSDELPTGNVIDFSRGIANAVVTRETRYGSSGGIEDVSDVPRR